MARMKRTGILGGTFDPIHCGHLAVADYAFQALKLDQLRVVPSASPPHRSGVQASGEARLYMAELAVAGRDGFVVDDREYRRDSPSYMVETLESLRRDFPDTALVLVLGLDSFVLLPGWHRWKELFGLAHLFVVSRPGENLPGSGELAEIISECLAGSAEEMFRSQQGRICLADDLKLPVSATEIRQRLAEGRAVDNLLPRKVRDWIVEQKLYT